MFGPKGVAFAWPHRRIRPLAHSCIWVVGSPISLRMSQDVVVPGPPATSVNADAHEGSVVVGMGSPHAIPQRIHRRDDEVLRYTSVTSESPVRISRRSSKAHVAVVVTMYNETANELDVTLLAIARNVAFLCKEDNDDYWKRVMLTVVVDGRLTMDEQASKSMQDMGLINFDAMAASVSVDPEVALHCFETTATFFDVQDNVLLKPLQLIVAVKERNQGKLSSHWWFFERISRTFYPEYCILLDIGTLPRHSTFHMFLCQFRKDENIAGICGQITTRTLTRTQLLNPIVAAQQFEYKIASVMDKSFESLLGFQSVLPGAFCAYRVSALRGSPLEAYFKQLFVAEGDLEPFQSNMMLAEDRVLCYEIVAKEQCSYTLGYMNAAVAETDVPVEFGSLLKQRRRWLNGSFFALLYALMNYPRLIHQTSHDMFTKTTLTFQFFFLSVGLLLQWFAMGVFVLVLRFVFVDVVRAPALVAWVSIILFAVLLAVQFSLALRSDPLKSSVTYTCSASLLGVAFVAMLAGTLWTGATHPVVLLTLFMTWGLYIVLALMHGELSTMASSCLGYLIMMPSFMIIMPIYAFSNVHDVSWGTKELHHSSYDSAKTESVGAHVRKRFQLFRMRLLTSWVSTNVLLVIVTVAYSALVPYVLLVIVYAMLFVNCARFIGSVAYLRSSQARMSVTAKMVLAPIRYKVWASVIKLPVSFFIAIYGASLVLWGLSDDNRRLRALAGKDLIFTHWQTSKSGPVLQEHPPLRRYFGMYRLAVTTLGVVLVAFFAELAAVVWQADAVEHVQIAAITFLTMAALNVAYVMDHTVRRVTKAISSRI
ncbi:chitin synthase [Plasmodiophora brassicae]|nr:hypothetical protein PBRA_003029 [Plasmodiophora brassicae]